MTSLDALRDGTWHADVAPNQRLVRIAGWQGKTRPVVVWHGRWFRRLDDGSYERAECQHNHVKRGVATRCAETQVRKLNRTTA